MDNITKSLYILYTKYHYAWGYPIYDTDMKDMYKQICFESSSPQYLEKIIDASISMAITDAIKNHSVNANELFNVSKGVKNFIKTHS